jgi:hypothetical protein
MMRATKFILALALVQAVACMNQPTDPQEQQQQLRATQATQTAQATGGGGPTAHVVPRCQDRYNTAEGCMKNGRGNPSYFEKTAQNACIEAGCTFACALKGTPVCDTAGKSSGGGTQKYSCTPNAQAPATTPQAPATTPQTGGGCPTANVLHSCKDKYNTAEGCMRNGPGNPSYFEKTAQKACVEAGCAFACELKGTPVCDLAGKSSGGGTQKYSCIAK